MKKTNIINQIIGENAEILLYGCIGKWNDIDVDVLVPALESLKNSGIKNLTFFVNSEGGEVPQGQTLFAYLNRTEFNVTFVVDGMAASMMAMLMTNPEHTVIANKYSKFMYHRLSGSVRGNADDVLAYTKMMDLFEADLIDMFATRTGIDKVKVKADYFNNTDKWLSAEEAKAIGLVNEIRDGNTEVVEPNSLVIPHDVYDHFNSQLLNFSNNNQSKNEMKKVAGLLNINENANEEVFATAVQNIINSEKQAKSDLASKTKESNELQAKLEEFDKAKVKTLIDNAINAKKFGEDMRGEFTEMATSNFVMTEKVIDKMPGVDATTLAGIGAGASSNKFAGKTYDDLFKSGDLENVKANHPALHAELYKAKFNKEYKPE